MMATIAQEFIEQGIEQGQVQILQEEILALLNIRFGLVKGVIPLRKNLCVLRAFVVYLAESR